MRRALISIEAKIEMVGCQSVSPSYILACQCERADSGGIFLSPGLSKCMFCAERNCDSNWKVSFCCDIFALQSPQQSDFDFLHSPNRESERGPVFGTGSPLSCLHFPPLFTAIAAKKRKKSLAINRLMIHDMRDEGKSSQFQFRL